ncbi:MAG: DUF3592 domain-containing protein [Aulosira sp. ZfuVER01]|nr:DUF3592 domain-containing protein [Aulosira sp. ZfuVER01]MDZ8002361.1 DUF3592 domain-containing protein [Aulosira sp. DedVER01a]MDZ8056425.1 DUF3592 domain-containing protein [Aulosira sp. ZfuCHP01]
MNVKLREITFEDKFSGILGVVIGVVFIGVGFWANNNFIHERATLTETQGTVVDTAHRRERDSKDKQKDTYAPIIEFLAKGDRVHFTGRYDSYRVSNGKIVAVRYDPKQPATTAREVQDFESLAPWMAFGMGGLSLVSGLRQLSPIRLSLGEGKA